MGGRWNREALGEVPDLDRGALKVLVSRDQLHLGGS